MITLERNGEEQSLADWGLSDEFELITSNLRASTLSLRKAVSVAGASIGADFNYGDKIILRINQSADLTGGTILFQGWRMKQVLNARADGSAFDFTFADVWFWLDQICFQQAYLAYNVANPLSPLLTYNSDLFLFRTIAGAMQNTGAQIAEVLNWANTCFNPTRRPSFGGSMDADQDLLTIGTVEPAVNVPSYQVKDIMCSEAIHNCLRSSPDVTVQIDHTTPLPTINFRKRLSAVAVGLPWKDGETHQSSRLIPRDDLQLNFVKLVFKRMNSVDGTNWFDPVVEIYPGSGWDGIEPGGLVQTIDIAGFDKSTVRGSLNVEAVPAAIVTPGGSQADRLAWWIKVHPQFDSTRYRNLTFGDVTIKDENDVAVSLTNFPNRLLADSGGLATWMRIGSTQVNGKKVKVEVTVAYDEYDVDATGGDRTAVNGVKLHSTIPNGRKFAVNLVLTNGTTGPYSATASETTPEPIPADLAQSIYTSLAALQFEGTHTIVQAPEAARLIGIQNTLNLTGGNAAWATMNAQIQEITEEFSSARRKTTISIGPAEHLAPGDLTQLFLFNRYRTVWNNPAIREQAVVDAGAELPNAAARENTTDALPEDSHQAIVYRPAGDPAGTPTGIIYNAPKQIGVILAATTPALVDPDKPAHIMQPTECAACDESGDPIYVILHAGGFYTKP